MTRTVKPRHDSDLPRGEELEPIVALVRMNSEKHAVAEFLARACGDEQNFEQYYKAVKRIGLVNSYVLLSAIKDPLSKIEQPARWFFWKAKSMKNVDNY